MEGVHGSDCLACVTCSVLRSRVREFVLAFDSPREGNSGPMQRLRPYTEPLVARAASWTDRACGRTNPSAAPCAMIHTINMPLPRVALLCVGHTSRQPSDRHNSQLLQCETNLDADPPAPSFIWQRQVPSSALAPNSEEPHHDTGDPSDQCYVISEGCHISVLEIAY